MKKLHLILAFLLVSVISFGQLTITVPTVTAMPGQTVNIPVILTGAGSPGTPISSANIHVSYDTAVLTYDTLTNFYSGTPGSQWYYSGNFNSDPACNSFAASANWLHPSLGTLAIPDGTTLYEMVFTYKGGSSPLSICIYEFTDVNFDFISTVAVNGAVNPPSLTGTDSFCGTGSAGNVYTTDAGMSNYIWTVSGGNITGGGTTTDNTVTVTWPTAGSHNVGVTYNTNVSASLPVTVTAKVNVSVSITASANPVTTGTSVTYTATPVNGGATPSFQWKVNGVIVGSSASTYSYVPVNGDQIFCLVTSSEGCVNNPIATSNVINMVVNSLPVTPLTVTLPEKYALPGEAVYFPVKLKGASASGSPVSSANIQISYDPAILAYDTLVNFYNAMPASQWFFSGNNNTVSANWIEPALLTLAIHDSTTLFEIKFTYLGGSQTLPFIVYEFTDDMFEFIPATPYNGSIAPFIPSLSGPEIVCQGAAGNVYTTVAGQSNYIWTVSGGTITSGGGSADHTVTVTWPTSGSHSVSVSYGSASTTTLPVTVTPKVTASISVAASQNPVTPGTTVTFTATPVNGGPTPDFQWKVNGVIVGTSSPSYSYIPTHGDQIFCLLTTSLTCVNNQIATSNVVTMTVTTPTALLVTLPDLTAMPGDVLYFPVKLKGAGSAGVPISSANVQISYDPAVLQYDTLTNFYSAMPAGQWYYSGNNNTVSANWIEPALLTLAIPDSTTLFEIKFTYLGGNSTLPFIVYEFTDATFEFIPTSHVDGSVNQLVPVNTSVQDVTVINGQDTCFNATNMITVAGNGTFFTVENGGTATFIAGQKISFLPGTTVNPGGYLHGTITLTGGYCGSMPATLVSTVTSTEETPDVAVSQANAMVRLYPNPTMESFTVELTGENTTVMTKAELFSVGGNKVMSVTLPEVRKHLFSGAGLAPGIYFMHIYTPKGSEILKVVKL